MRPQTAKALRGPPCTLCDVIKYGYFHQVRLLISSGINLEARDSLRRTPLILCAFMRPEKWGSSIAMTLIEYGVRVAQRDCYSRNALHYACIYECENLARVLLKAIDFDLNQTDKMGNTALHYAAMSGNFAITQLLAQTFKKYRISADKVNHHGRTAREEAIVAGNSACAHSIKLELSGRRSRSAHKDVRFADDVTLASDTSRPGSRSFAPTSKRLTSRPMSAAFLTRGDSSSSVNSVDEGRSSLTYRSRSSISLPSGGFYRKSQQPLYAHGYKRDEELIHCAPNSDFRNNPVYVFKLVKMPYHPDSWSVVSLMDSATHNSVTWTDAGSVAQSQQVSTSLDWRHELKQLFKVYENQCSASWRATRKTERVPTTPVPSSPSPEDEEKGRRGRRQSVVSKNAHTHGKDGNSDQRRRSSTARLRRMNSTVSKNMDGALDTSSESINSLASSKRRGLEKEAGTGRADSLTPKPRRRLSKDTLSPTPSPAPSPSPSPPPPSAIGDTSINDVTTASRIKNSTRRITENNDVDLLSAQNNARQQQEVALGDQRLVSNKTSLSKHNNSSTEENTKETVSAPYQNNGVNINSAIPVVKETLVDDLRRRSSSDEPCQVDTNKLLVPNPYEQDDDDEEMNETDD